MVTADVPVVTPDQILRLPQEAGGVRWWLFQTATNAEVELAQIVDACGALPVVVMTVKKRKNGAGRPFRSREVPLYPSYAFANGTEEQAYEARRQHRRGFPCTILPVTYQSRAALQLARSIELAAAIEELQSMRLQPGKAVEVRSGPWQGKQGIVVESRPGHVCFEMEVMGRMVPVEIDPELLDTI